MELSDWIPAISTTSLFTVALWLGRNLIATRLNASVQHEFNRDLEKMRTELRNSEELFKADLRARDAQFELVRTNVMSGIASRQAALDKRRIEAVEQLWSAVVEQTNAKFASSMLCSFNYEAALKESSVNSELRKMFDRFPTGMEPKAVECTLAYKARPFVSEIAWAIFSAYQAILSLAVMKIQMLKIGLNMPSLLKSSAVKDLAKAALPHQSAFLDVHGADGVHLLVDELEMLLLAKLKESLKGTESDKENISQAALIMQEAEKVMRTISDIAAKPRPA